MEHSLPLPFGCLPQPLLSFYPLPPCCFGPHDSSLPDPTHHCCALGTDPLNVLKYRENIFHAILGYRWISEDIAMHENARFSCVISWNIQLSPGLS